MLVKWTDRKIAVSVSSKHTRTPAFAVVDHVFGRNRGSTSDKFFTSDAPASWVNFKLPVAVRPTHYVLANNHHTNFLRSWSLQGSNDGLNWRTLMGHRNDRTLSQSNPVGVFTLPQPQPSEYSFYWFRILMEGPCEANSNYLGISGFELFGSARL